jgi:hypothetical protein
MSFSKLSSHIHFIQSKQMMAVVTAMIIGLGCDLWAQNPQIHPRAGSRFPTVVFTSVLWSAEPSYYSIALDSSGTATYQSAPDAITRTGVPYTIEFQVSDRTRRTTFNVTRQLNYFADAGTQSVGAAEKVPVRTLGYHDGSFRHQITYSSSSDQEIQELTSVFEEISETLEYGRRLDYYHEHDAARLETELADLKAACDQRRARELQAIAPVLRNIAADGKLGARSREFAEILLKATSR